MLFISWNSPATSSRKSIELLVQGPHPFREEPHLPPEALRYHIKMAPGLGL
jgi:hypothetical protein